MQHHHLQHQNSIKLNKLYSTLLKLCQNILLSITIVIAEKYFRKYDVVTDDLITYFARICAVREKLDIILSIKHQRKLGVVFVIIC